MLADPGLSPRVRGNPLSPRRRNAIYGSIPACAGEPVIIQRMSLSSAVYPRVCGGTVYPRVCGGTHWPSSSFCARNGLSPRVRGNPRPARAAHPLRGSIPACAGEPGAW